MPEPFHYNYHNVFDKLSLNEAEELLSAALHNYKTAVGYGLMKYKLTSDALELALWDMDIIDEDPESPHNRFTCSQEFRDMLGYRDEADFPNLITSWSDRLHPDDKERTISALKAHLEDHSGKTPYDVTYRMRTISGNYRYFQSFGTTMRNSSGVPICVAGALADITEKRQTQEQLETIWERVESGIVIIDAETRELLVVNPAAVNMFGSSIDTMLGKKCHEVFCTSERCPIMDENQEIDRSERQFIRANGEMITVIKSVSKITYNGRLALLENFTDISHMKEVQEKQRQLEMAEQASKTKSAFLANMSHEIRTPMNAIIGMTELLLCSNHLTEHDVDCLNDINVSAHSLLSIINDILDMSKIESGKMELSPVHYDFKALIESEATMFTYVAKKKGIEFKLEMGAGIPGTLFGDDVRLRQVLTNICGNAVKFTENGYVKLKVTVPDGADSIVMEVSDTGMGIRKEDIPKLFHAFEQSKTEKNRYIAGTGLGLVISKSFVELMGGGIRLDSEQGKGTVFTITIPATPGDPSKVRHDEADHVQSICAPRARVLVVDDNEYNLKVAHGLLELYEIDAETASSGKDAVEMAAKNDYDIVFMDHMMPDMDGIEATAAIRALGEKQGKLTVIALTANAIRGAEEMFLQNGINGFLSKPIEMPDLTRILVDWLPPEKVLKKAKGKAVDDGGEHDAFLESLGGIEEMDAEIGLRHFSGEKGMYRDSLKLFHERLAHDGEKLAALMEERNYGHFAIAVHAMKSTLAGIGATELSDIAFRLEMASKKNEADYCISRFPGFLEGLMSLHGKLSLVFPPDEAEAGKKEKGDEAVLREFVKKASDAVDSYDGDGAMEALKGISSCSYGEKRDSLLADAASAVRRYDFDGAKVILAKIK